MTHNNTTTKGNEMETTTRTDADDIRQTLDGKDVVVIEHSLRRGEDYYRVRELHALRMDVWEVHSSELKPRRRRRR